MPEVFLGREFKVERGLVYLARAIVRMLTLPLCWLPEGVSREFVRRLVLRVQNSLPIELAVSRGETAVQVGSPHPRTLRRFSRAVGATGRVILFEAEPTNFARLQSTAEAEGLSNVILIPAAAWSESGMGELMVSRFSGDHKVRLDGILVDNDLRAGNRQMERIECRLLRIDEALAERGIGSIDYLSVTVNGGELEVLRGAEGILRSSPKVRVYAKGHALQQSDGKPINVPLRAWLESLGFATMKTRGEPSSTRDERWRWRDGDAYGWKNQEDGVGNAGSTGPAGGAMSSVRTFFARACLPLMALVIAVLPLQFLRIGHMANFKVSILHAAGALLIAAAIIGYGRRLLRGFHWFEYLLVFFLVATSLSIFSDAVPRKTFAFLSFVIKPSFYIVLLRVMLVVMSSCRAVAVLRTWRWGAAVGVALFFTLFSVSALLLISGVASNGRCEALAFNPDATLPFQDESEGGDLPNGEADLSVLAEFANDRLFVKALREFDRFFPVDPVGCSRNIGPNALAGSFLVYFCVLLLLFDERHRAVFAVLIAVSLLFLALSASRGTIGLMIACGAWFWLVRRPWVDRFRRAWAGPTFTIAVLGSVAVVAMVVIGAFDQAFEDLAARVSRISQYHEAVRLIREHPLTGMGVGYRITHAYGSVYVHNFLLSTWLMMGILGLIAAAAIIAGLLIQLHRALVGPVGDGRFGQAASLAAALLLFSPLVSLMLRASIESIFLISDWFLLALFLTIANAGAKEDL